MNAATGDAFEPAYDGVQDRVVKDGQAARQDAGADPWDESWADEDAALSVLVRPYTLTRGRTRPAEGASFDVIAQVIAVERSPLSDPDGAYGADFPEHQAILALVQDRPLSVAEVAAGTDLPLGVVRILLGDLLEAERIRVGRTVPAAEIPDAGMLREVIRALQAL